MEGKRMIHDISKMCGMAMAGICLVSTLAIAQPVAPGERMVCTKIDASGYCVEAKSKDNKMRPIRVEGVKVSEEVECVTSGGDTKCTKVTKIK
jgi:hypothetical protein